MADGGILFQRFADVVSRLKPSSQRAFSELRCCPPFRFSALFYLREHAIDSNIMESLRAPMYPELVTLNRDEIDLLIKPWHHGFTMLGLKISQRRETRRSACMLCVCPPI
jgi:hypothetical protein